jgi:hypothetical protein
MSAGRISISTGTFDRRAAFGGNISRVPRMAIGTTGRSVRAAALNAPFLNGSILPSSAVVPSGNTSSDCPQPAHRPWPARCPPGFATNLD